MMTAFSVRCISFPGCLPAFVNIERSRLLNIRILLHCTILYYLITQAVMNRSRSAFVATVSLLRPCFLSIQHDLNSCASFLA